MATDGWWHYPKPVVSIKVTCECGKQYGLGSPSLDGFEDLYNRMAECLNRCDCKRGQDGI